MEAGRTNRESITSAGPNSADRTFTLRIVRACLPIGPANAWRRHSVTTMTP
jgi:hypothetical protein